MRITMLSVGTRGDVQPYVALGLGLRAAGHDVRIATNADMVGFVRERGLDAAAVTGDSARWTGWLTAAPSRARPDRLLGALRRRAAAFEEMLTLLVRHAWRAARGSDLLLSSATGFWAGQPIARSLGIAHGSAFIQPWHPTSAFPQLYWPRLRVGPAPLRSAYHRSTHRLTLWGLRHLFGGARRRALEATLGAGPPPYDRDPLTLYGFSPSWIPPPADWSERARVTGFWFLDEGAGWRPPPRLTAFLAAGPPPVYVGFGSLAGVRPALVEMAVEALTRAGLRGLVAAEAGESLPAGVLALAGAPHDWLFDRVAAVVHHAGAGTTGAALRAGRPSVAVPFLHDHAFFARRLHDGGLAPPPVPAARATADRLRAAIERATTDPAMSARAVRLRAEIAAEHGVRRAVELIERRYARREERCG
jgi:sterol 3beta-glucosyltransferase